MTTTWKTKVAPALKAFFDKDGKKAAAAEFSKSFNKEEIGKEIDAKKDELSPKVLEVYEAAPAEIKHLITTSKSTKIAKKYSTVVPKFLEGLAKIEFPGAQAVSEAVTKSGTTLVSGPVLFLFGKVATFVPKEEPKVEEKTEASREVTATVEAEKTEETSETVEEVKKEEEVKTETETETSAPAAPEAPKEEPAAEPPKQ
ncbi:plasma-membrane associated cation-binding protein 1 [Rhynchospora pubera]|uniref:Plasma-membrane associated cation-binding protein 1 n=1 Tax=Rhynchospora pubera TaxID=906938 RepID=A0AAV8DGR0_9POAL|nr:plasma-membrane associated cation-binding protein 1 [Rhynchospora pubera]